MMDRSAQVELAIEKAAMWLSEQQATPPQVIAVLCKEFELSALQACEACKLAQQYRTNRKAFG